VDRLTNGLYSGPQGTAQRHGNVGSVTEYLPRVALPRVPSFSRSAHALRGGARQTEMVP
jgi:hypothetical protein